MSLKKSRRLITAAAVAVGVLAVGGAALVFTNSASAQEPTATISFADGKLNFQALPGQVNNLVVGAGESLSDRGEYGESQYTYTFDDDVAIEEVGGTHHCGHANENDRTEIWCTWGVKHGPDPVVVSDFRLGDMNDTVKFRSGNTDGPGTDQIHLGAGSDRYENAAAEESSVVQGGAGGDSISTGSLVGELARVEGGSGNDFLQVKGEGARAWGNAGLDHLSGGSGRQYLYGGEGADRFKAGSGNDELNGGGGDDWMYAESGNDKLWGNAGADHLSGGLGNDTLIGGLDQDKLDGGSGKNTLKQ